MKDECQECERHSAHIERQERRIGRLHQQVQGRSETIRKYTATINKHERSILDLRDKMSAVVAIGEEALEIDPIEFDSRYERKEDVNPGSDQ
jgi:hypothetical protein